MKNRIPYALATRWIFVLFGLFIVFHFSIIIGIVLLDFAPVDYLWGGRMDTAEELLVFEAISLALNILFLVIVLIRTGRIQAPKLVAVSRILLWLMTLLFVFNTLGNLVAKTTFEQCFAVVTAALAILCLRVALEPIRKQEEA